VDAAIRACFSPAEGIAYLDTATYGLPPDPTVTAMRRALEAWQAGTGDWIADWDRPAEAARASFARLVGTTAERIALLPAVSIGVGYIAAGLGPGDEVIVPADEFTSVLFPLLVARERGVIVREVEAAALADEIRPGTTLVAASLVQMQTGRMADLPAILDRAEAVGARVLVDATQAVPFVPVASMIGRIEYLVVAAYKHLLCPRGVAFLALGRGDPRDIAPLDVGWKAADEPYGRFFGGPLTLPPDARRLDVSLAWLPWIGAIESLRLLVDWAAAGAFDAPLALARALADRVGVEWGGASLVCAPIRDANVARGVLREAGVKAAVRGSAIRFSTHVYNDPSDIDRAAVAIEPFVES
jgi:selenocysteine lyase/cysteine desulfurase